MLKKLFSKKNKLIEIYSPLDGEVIDLNKVPDDGFSSGAIGDGVAIIPNGDTIFSPIDSEETSIISTRHAVSFKQGKLELIVHFGIDTVELKGEGFEVLIGEESEGVKQGEELIKYNKEYIEQNAKSIISPVVVISEEDEIEELSEIKYGDVKAGDLLFKVKIK